MGFTVRTFGLGQRLDLTLPDYNVELLAGNTTIASNNSVIPDPGTFAPISATYTSAANDPLLGELLTIRLSSPGGNPVFSEQIGFDNVSLDASVIPEPTTIMGSLLASGLLFQIRRNKNSKNS